MDQDIDNLYLQFKEEISHKKNDMYYDEEDLVIIFDTATDYNDLYTQIEVIALGRKLFPSSKDLEMRLGFILAQYNNIRSLDDFNNNNLDQSGTIWKILRLRSKGYDKDFSIRLTEFVRGNSFNDEEAVIQFMDLLEATDHTHWLSENCDLLLDKCKYRDHALEECAELLEVSDPHKAITLCNELSEIDPFNFDNWFRLSRLNLDMGCIEESSNAMEYARALEPDSPSILALEIRQLAISDPQGPRVKELIEKALQNKSGNITIINAISDYYGKTGDYDAATNLWQDFLKKNPGNEFAEFQLSYFNNPDKHSYLTDSDSDGDNNREYPETALIDNVNTFLEDDNSRDALTLIESYKEKMGYIKKRPLYIQLLYKAGRFNDIIDFINLDRQNDNKELMLTPISLTMYAASLLRTGRYEEALSVSQDYLQHAATLCNTLEMKMNLAGARITFEYIYRQALTADYSCHRDPIAESLETI